MKSEVILPYVPENLESSLRRFSLDTVNELKDLRYETADGLTKAEGLYKNNIKEISDDYDMKVSDPYDLYVITGLTADSDFNLVSYLELYGRTFDVLNLSSYTVSCNPTGTENINDWNFRFDITEKGGRLRFLALSDRWVVTPLNDACVYYVESETADTGLALDGSWDDVAGMELLDGVYGGFLLDSFGQQYGGDTSFGEYIVGEFGLGKISGDNAPNIKYNRTVGYRNSGQTTYIFQAERHVHNWGYISDGSAIYMKSKVYSDELNVTSHFMYGDTGCPMYVKARRIF